MPFLTFILRNLRRATRRTLLTLLSLSLSLFLVTSLSWSFSGVHGIAAASAESAEWRVAPRKAAQKNPVATDEQSLAIGRRLYQRECLSCHGITGKGDGPAAGELERPAGDLSSPTTLSQSDGGLFWKITIGRKPMPSFRTLLTDKERWHVVNYLRTLVDQDGGPTREARPSVR